MVLNYDNEYLTGLVLELIKNGESESVEFKHDTKKPEDIGEYISALSNGAALEGKANGYMIWGIDDESRSIVGTKFRPSKGKVGNEGLENWLLRLLTPKIHFEFYEVNIEEHNVVLLEIEHAHREPVQFKKQDFIPNGSYKKPLKEHPEKERALWRIFDDTPFEEKIALENILGLDVVTYLDYPAYFDKLHKTPPPDLEKILAALEADKMIGRTEAGKWNIFNLGAILFAKNLSDFRKLERKSVRVIVYDGRGRIKTIREQVGGKGYARSLSGNQANHIEYCSKIL